MHARVELALQKAMNYIRYVQVEDPELHARADGQPSITKEVAGILSGVDNK